jgi:hypothetical protein
MSTTFTRALWCVIAAIGGLASAVPAASADPPAPACQSGYVWRAARPGDAVCVTPQVRDLTAQENAAAPQNVQPNDGNVCKSGFVWRNAYSGDAACVTPPQRDQAAADNAAAASHTVAQPAGCQRWRAPGSTLGLAQDDGYVVFIAATAQTLGPQATFSGGGKPDVNGTVAGGTTFQGNKFTVNVNWNNAWASTYYGTINPDGTATGYVDSSDTHVPLGVALDPDQKFDSHSNFHAMDKFLCDQ